MEKKKLVHKDDIGCFVIILILSFLIVQGIWYLKHGCLPFFQCL